ncbi:hypothetical protein [Streptomyces sp. NBC_01304]|uniref:hypothetical protein n=1 Tax=Streptomyces sp. NBC_01304 TaxID=2903818 RepID=UPI002E16528F|nr:hypothetical protein OG430_43120 [Streptomyces sp. NBC_01304]
MRTHLGKAAGTLAAALLAGLSAAPAADAADPVPVDPGVSCHGGVVRMSLKPGLMFGNRQQTWTGSGLTTGCTSTDPRQSVSAAEISFSGNGKGSCLPALGIPNAELTGSIRWSVPGRGDAKPVSKVRGTARLGATGAVFEGVVTDGLYDGSKVHATADWELSTNLAEAVVGCFTSGYMDVSGTWDHLVVDVA